MTVSTPTARTLRLIVLGLVAISLVGCGWLRGRSDYEQSPETRPLEVPPDLDTPPTDPSMRVPSPGSGAAAAASNPGGAPPSSSTAVASSVAVADTVQSTWRRVGLALERIDGVQIDDRAELLSVYNVSYRGASFLVQVQPDGANAKIVAVDGDGRSIGEGPAVELLGLLRQRLG